MDFILRVFVFTFLWCAKCSGEDTSFKILWNVPTIQCSKTFHIDFLPLLHAFGILANKDDQFKGDMITIFYENQLGLYPWLNGDVPVNGGIPQNADVAAHLKQATLDIQTAIPNRNFNGLGVIDWESWRPVWDFNFGTLKKYQEKSFEPAQSQHPNWKNDSIIKLASQQWENSTKKFMLETLMLAKRMRPDGLWCYYLFPDCYNYKGESPEDFKCSPNILKGNDKLSWLWEASSAICPSLYVDDGYLEKYTFDQRTWYVNGRLQEAVRLASGTQLYPYVGYGITPGVMVPKDDFWRILAQTASAGSSGAVIWGSSASLTSKTFCEMLESYIKDVLGPAVKTIVFNTEKCAKDVCNNRGRCTWPKDPNVKAWKRYIETDEHPYNKNNITCRCLQGYEGQFCDKITT